MEMSERIKERRIFMGYTQEELGEKLGLQKSAIAKYENGRVENIKRSVIANMAKILDCSPSYLMGFDVLMEKTVSSKEDSPKILQYYEMLNDIGKHVATERVKELTEVSRYVKEDTPDYLKPNAAHDRTDIEVTDEMRHYDDNIMDDKNF